LTAGKETSRIPQIAVIDRYHALYDDIIMTEKRQVKRGLLEEVPTIKPGDRVLRRQRKPYGILRTLSEKVSRLFKGTAAK